MPAIMRYAPASRAERSADRFQRRLSEIDPASGSQRCAVFGCSREPQAKTGQGFSELHCRYHLQYRNRHGSFWKGTYTAAQLKPYRAAVHHCLRGTADPVVRIALHDLQMLMWKAGLPLRHLDTRRMSTADKAKAALTRFRAANVSAGTLLVNHLAITAAVLEDPIGPGGEPDEYRLVQVAKACFRLGSGHHTVFSRGSFHHPRSSGRVLRVLGKMIDGPCAPVAEKHLEAILAMKHEGDAR